MRIAGLLLAGLLVFGSAYGIALSSSGHRDIDIEVLNISRETENSSFDRMTVRVENRADQELEPVFRVIHQGSVSYLRWRTASGPAALEPGEEGVYRLEAEKMFSPLFPGVEFAVVVSGPDERWWSPSRVMAAPRGY